MTVAQWLRDWLAYVEGSVRPRTYNDYRSVCENHLIPGLGRVPLQRLTPSRVERLLMDTHEKGLTIKTVRNIRGVLVRALNRAQRDLGLPRNAASLARMPRAQRPSFTPETVSPDQARSILAAFDGSRLQPLALFSIATGMRQV